MRALLFPGQGAQKTVYTHPFAMQPFAELPEVAPLLQAAQHHVHFDLRQAPTGPSSQEAVQMYFYIVGVASAALLTKRGLPIDAVAGLSIGTFSAAVACGAATFESLLPIVVQRGRLMQAAFPTGNGLGLLEGLPEAAVDKLIHQQGSRAEMPLSIAIVHPGRRIVVAGSWASLDTLFDTARAAGATRAYRLDVPCPSHSPGMAPVASALEKALRNIPFKHPACPYFSNSRNRLIQDPEVIREDLAWNVARPIRWSDGLDLLREVGIREFIEAFPGDSLRRMSESMELNEVWYSLP